MRLSVKSGTRAGKVARAPASFAISRHGEQNINQFTAVVDQYSLARLMLRKSLRKLFANTSRTSSRISLKVNDAKLTTDKAGLRSGFGIPCSQRCREARLRFIGYGYQTAAYSAQEQFELSFQTVAALFYGIRTNWHQEPLLSVRSST